MSDLVLTQVEDRVALITVNDPDRRNAVTAEISAALRAAVDAAEANVDVHAVIVTGAGKAFCAGADLTALGAAAADGLRVIYDGFLAVAECALPTIAAVNGPAVGAGLNLALAADVRIAGPAALFDPRFQKARHPSRRRGDVDVAAGGRPAGGQGVAAVRDAVRRRNRGATRPGTAGRR